MNELHARIAKELGWPLSDVKSFSLHTLREIVKCPKLKHACSEAIRTGEYLVRAR